VVYFAVQEPTHKEARVDYVLEDMQVMSDFELHKLCLKYEVCEAVGDIFILDEMLLGDLTKLNVVNLLFFDISDKSHVLMSMVCQCKVVWSPTFHCRPM